MSNLAEYSYVDRRESARENQVVVLLLLQKRGWHHLPQLPEFTVCDDCYHDVVWPAITSGSELAGQFTRVVHRENPVDDGNGGT